VYRIKERFNQEFEEVFHAKEAEIQHVREKNVRIKKIINDLKLSDEKIHEPGNGSLSIGLHLSQPNCLIFCFSSIWLYCNELV